jgi:hypothetical protein
MRFWFLFFFAFMAMFSSNHAMADDYDRSGLCTASAFLTDFRDGFGSERDAFDWCFARVEWWGLDRSDGWRKRFCRVNRYSSGYNQWKWRGQFWHHFGDYSGRFPGDLFGQFNDVFGHRLFQGFGGRIQFHFGERCGGYGL